MSLSLPGFRIHRYKNWVCVSGPEPQPHGDIRDITDSFPESAGIRSASSARLYLQHSGQTPFCAFYSEEEGTLVQGEVKSRVLTLLVFTAAPRFSFLPPFLPWGRASLLSWDFWAI